MTVLRLVTGVSAQTGKFILMFDKCLLFQVYEMTFKCLVGLLHRERKNPDTLHVAL